DFGDRSYNAGGPDRDHGRAGIGIGGAATFSHLGSSGFLDAGSGDGVDWNLRGYELPGDSTHTRGRDPAHRGRESSRWTEAGASPGGGVDGRGGGFGDSRIDPSGAIDCEAAF